MKKESIITGSRNVWKASVQLISAANAEAMRPADVLTVLRGTINGFLPTKYMRNQTLQRLYCQAAELPEDISQMKVDSPEEYEAVRVIAQEVYMLYGESMASHSWWANAGHILEENIASGTKPDTERFVDMIAVLECRFECVGTPQNLLNYINEQLEI